MREKSEESADLTAFLRMGRMCAPTGREILEGGRLRRRLRDWASGERNRIERSEDYRQAVGKQEASLGKPKEGWIDRASRRQAFFFFRLASSVIG